MQWAYLAGLIFSIAGLALFDRRHKLVFFDDALQAAITIGTGMIILLVWDVAGIALGIFYSGGSPYALPFMVLPEVPIEEFCFLFLLCYITLLIYRGGVHGYRHLFSPQ